MLPFWIARIQAIVKAYTFTFFSLLKKALIFLSFLIFLNIPWVLLFLVDLLQSFTVMNFGLHTNTK